MRLPFTDATKEKAAELGSGAAEITAVRDCQHTKKLPAYGRALLDAQRQGFNVPWLCISLDWNLGRAFPRVVITPDTQAHELDFRLVRGLGCMVAHRGETSRALDVAEAALMAGATECPVFDVALGRLTTTTDEVMAARGLRAAA